MHEGKEGRDVHSLLHFLVLLLLCVLVINLHGRVVD